MATPFVPVPVPMQQQTQPVTCSSWPKRTSPLGSPCDSSPTGKTTWERSTGCLGATLPCPSLPQTEGHGRPSRGKQRCVQEDGTSRDDWEERPSTPTLLGYEIMEERAKFTVYKILVKKNQEDSWVIFRRYTDFSRLNDKLKELFPRFRLSLPPKRWFKDNYDMEFLEERQIGLQTFLQNLIAHKDIINSAVVRQFLCLDDPPGPFDSLEESRAFCETLEETNHRLQKELQEKQKEIDSLRRALEEREVSIALLEQRVSGDSPHPESPESPCRLLTESSEKSAETSTSTDGHGDTDRRSTEFEARPETMCGESCDDQRTVKGHRVQWCSPVVNGCPGPS
ncbi:sorting nexin-16 [Osmerus eperlanus]|uniref:sorting nexin-16 n=1 Tax=Osmerus eperlanus TaxID=29151 RepID=UPI002E117F73